jgi:hypothetical protein
MSDALGSTILAVRHNRLRTALIVSLGLTIITFLFEVAELASSYSLNTDPEVDLTILDWLNLLIAVALIVVAITTIVLWCMWVHRAARNISESQATAFSFSPAWSVGWYFIPFANLITPFGVMREIWNASVGDMAHLDTPQPLVTLWWLSWISSSILSNISLRISLNAETAEGLYWSTAVGAVSSILSFIAIPAAIKMLDAITRGQQQRY